MSFTTVSILLYVGSAAVGVFIGWCVAKLDELHKRDKLAEKIADGEVEALRDVLQNSLTLQQVELMYNDRCGCAESIPDSESN